MKEQGTSVKEQDQHLKVKGPTNFKSTPQEAKRKKLIGSADKAFYVGKS